MLKAWRFLLKQFHLKLGLVVMRNRLLKVVVNDNNFQ